MIPCSHPHTSDGNCLLWQCRHQQDLEREGGKGNGDEVTTKTKTTDAINTDELYLQIRDWIINGKAVTDELENGLCLGFAPNERTLAVSRPGVMYGTLPEGAPTHEEAIAVQTALERAFASIDPFGFLPIVRRGDLEQQPRRGGKHYRWFVRRLTWDWPERNL